MPGHVGAAALFAEKDFGGVLAHTFEIQTIGVAQSQIFGNDPDRVWTLLQNLSANTIYAIYDESVSSTRGIILAANGGLLSFSARIDYILPTLQMNAIATAANSALLVLTLRRIALTEV